MRSKRQLKNKTPFLTKRHFITRLVTYFTLKPSNEKRSSSKRSGNRGYRRGYFYVLGLILCGLCVYALVSYNVIDTVRHYVLDRLSQISSNIGFTISDVYVDGRKNASQQQILEAVGARRGDPLLGYNITSIRENLEKITWVKTAVVQRRFPNILYVELLERKPIALWQHQDQFFLVDHEGFAIEPNTSQVFSHLPVIMGPEAPTHAPLMLALLERFPLIKKHLRSLLRVRDRRWNLTIFDNTCVKLPDEQQEEALAHLSLLIENKKITPGDVSMIDLRIKNRIILQITPLAAISLKTKGKET